MFYTLHRLQDRRQDNRRELEEVMAWSNEAHSGGANWGCMIWIGIGIGIGSSGIGNEVGIQSRVS
jgi:hypothetical protein